MSRTPSKSDYAVGETGQYLYKRNNQEVWLEAKVVDVWHLTLEIEFTHPPSKHLRGGYRERRWLRTREERDRFVTS